MNLHEKIAEIMRSVKFVQKDGQVAYKDTKYKYISEAKLTSILRAEFIEKGIVVYPEKLESSRTGNITHLNVTYRMVNTDDPNDFIYIASCGDGADTQDKGSSKAMTMAYKYMLLRTFAIPTGDDPDEYGSDELTDKFLREEEKDAQECAKLRDIILNLAEGDTDRIETFCKNKFGKPFDSLSAPELKSAKVTIAKAVQK